MKNTLTALLCALSFSLFSTPLMAARGFCAELETFNHDYFNDPTHIIWHPTRKAWLISERKGNLFLLSPRTGFSAHLTQLDQQLDTRNNGGLISMAFHPTYPESPFLYVSRTILSENQRLLVLEEYRVEDDIRLQLETRKQLIKVVMPGLHNTGGEIVFDNFGFLYMSIGDGSSDEDALKNAPNPNTLLGSLIRLDTNNPTNNYLAPNNPFSSFLDGAPEVFAYGFRDPRSLTVDRDNNNMWLTDSGLHTLAEINLIRPQFFYGWSCREGHQKISQDASCNQDVLRLERQPDFSHGLSVGAALIGGGVYHGARNPNWRKRYLFADSLTGRMWSIAVRGSHLDKSDLVQMHPGAQSGIKFAHDERGEMVFLDFQGKVSHLVGTACPAPQ